MHGFFYIFISKFFHKTKVFLKKYTKIIIALYIQYKKKGLNTEIIKIPVKKLI